MHIYQSPFSASFSASAAINFAWVIKKFFSFFFKPIIRITKRSIIDIIIENIAIFLLLFFLNSFCMASSLCFLTTSINESCTNSIYSTPLTLLFFIRRFLSKASLYFLLNFIFSNAEQSLATLTRLSLSTNTEAMVLRSSKEMLHSFTLSL